MSLTPEAPEEEDLPLSEQDWQRLRGLASATTVDLVKKSQLEDLVSSAIQDMTKRKSNRSDDDH